MQYNQSRVSEEVIAHYRIEELIGQGSMGVVYRAIDEKDGSPVALKVFYPDSQLTHSQQQDLLRRFEKEANILREIKHENVVGYREFGSFEGKEYLAMEYLEGQNLKDLLEMNVAFSLEEVVDIGLQVLSGLSSCHERGIIHRDIKPANIVKLPSGVVKLTDFGIARILTDATISKTGMVVGTPNYMSPEQIKGEELTPATDIFSLGVVIYELVTRRKPFDGETIATIMYNVVNLNPPSPRFFSSEIPENAETAINRAIAKDPRDRYPNAREFQKDLMAIVQELPVPTSPSNQEPATRYRGEVGGRKVVYCVDCGTPNPSNRYTCINCKLPLIKRETHKAGLTAQQPQITAEARFDRALLIFLNSLLAGIIIFIIYLFFHG